MIRRSLAVAVLATVVALAPMAAFGASYPAPGSALTCSQTTVPAGTAFTCTIQGPSGDAASFVATTSGANASLAAPVSSTQSIGTSNATVFTVTAPDSASTITLTGSVGGTPTNTARVTVTAPALQTVTLAAHSTPNYGIAIWAGILLVLGAAVLFIIAFRRRERVSP